MCKHKYTYRNAWIYIQAHKQTDTHMYRHKYTHIYVHTEIYPNTYTYRHIHIQIHKHWHICKYIHSWIQTHTHTHASTNTLTCIHSFEGFFFFTESQWCCEGSKIFYFEVFLLSLRITDIGHYGHEKQKSSSLHY